MIRKTAPFLLPLLLCGLAACSSASGPARTPVITSGSSDGALLMRIRTPVGVKTATLHFAMEQNRPPERVGDRVLERSTWRTLAVKHTNKPGRLSGFVGGNADTVHLLTVEPGTYVFEGSVLKTQDMAFANCPGQSVLAFEVSPGHVTYVGDVDFTRTPSTYAEVLPNGIEHTGAGPVTVNPQAAGYAREIFVQDFGTARNSLIEKNGTAAELVAARFFDIPYQERDAMSADDQVLAACRAAKRP